MNFITEKKVYTDYYAGTVDLITGVEDFESKIDFEEETHTYKKDGVILPSVTTLLNPIGYDWFDPSEDFYYSTATEIGINIHKEIEQYLNKSIEGKSPEFKEFKKILEKNKKIFEQKAIFDYKTYSECERKRREKCYYQICLYARAIFEMTGEIINKAYMIWLPRHEYIFLKQQKKAQIIDLTLEFGPIFTFTSDKNTVIDWKCNKEFLLYGKEFISIGIPNVLLSKKTFLFDTYQEAKVLAKKYLPTLSSNLMTSTQAIIYYNFCERFDLKIPDNFWLDYSSNFYRANRINENDYDKEIYFVKVVAYLNSEIPIIGDGNEEEPYKIDENYLKKIEEQQKKDLFIKTLLKSTRRKNTTGVQIIMCDENGREIKKFNSIRAAAQCLNISSTAIQNALEGKQIHAGGYKWKKTDNSKKIKRQKRNKTSVNKEGKHIVMMNEEGVILKEFQSVNEATRRTKINKTSLRDAANGKQQHAGGYRWKFKD